MMFSKSLLLCLVAAATEAATTVSVLNFGNKQSVRATTTASTKQTSVAGVVSFWNALENRKSLQQPGMTVVPDLFQKPTSVVVLSVSGEGVDLEHMPTVQKILSEEESVAVGQFHVNGNQASALLQSKSSGTTKKCHHQNLAKDFKSGKTGSALDVSVENEDDARKVDAQIAALIADLKKSTHDDSIVIHLVVEEGENGAARRRLSENETSRRRLEDEQQEEEQDEAEEEDGNNDNNNGYYGYGYYNSQGEWVTPYKTMFQIQYFNVVLWTAVGLTVTLFYTIYLVTDMPLEADTLLFGESAKMSVD